MRVGIDVSAAVGGPSGLQRYLQSFLAALAEVDRKDEFILCSFFWKGFPERALEAGLPTAPNFRLHIKRIPQRLLLPAEHYSGLRLQQRLLAPLGLDVFHGTAAVLPRLRNLPSVLTMHHVGGLEPGLSAWDEFYFKRLTERSLAQADLILSISEETRRNLIREHGVAPERARTVYYGGADAAFRFNADEEDLSRHGIHMPYFLFVSAINARKNLGLLAKAFARLKRTSPGRHQLVFVARKDPAYFESFRRTLAELGVEQDAVFLEGLGPGDLRALYQQSRAMVYPSTLEGFGLPLLEAMACGAPVIAANASCLPEIGGDACLYVDPADDEALAGLMRRVDSDEALRKDLRAKGFARVERFSWRRNAQETLDAYRELGPKP